MAETAQYLIGHGHTLAQIATYPPHLLGRMIVAAHRLEARLSKERTLSVWLGTHIDKQGLQQFLKDKQGF